jgi:hypothetical protein
MFMWQSFEKEVGELIYEDWISYMSSYMAPNPHMTFWDLIYERPGSHI